MPVEEQNNNRGVEPGFFSGSLEFFENAYGFIAGPVKSAATAASEVAGSVADAAAGYGQSALNTLGGAASYVQNSVATTLGGVASSAREIAIGAATSGIMYAPNASASMFSLFPGGESSASLSETDLYSFVSKLMPSDVPGKNKEEAMMICGKIAKGYEKSNGSMNAKLLANVINLIRVSKIKSDTISPLLQFLKGLGGLPKDNVDVNELAEVIHRAAQLSDDPEQSQSKSDVIGHMAKNIDQIVAGNLPVTALKTVALELMGQLKSPHVSEIVGHVVKSEDDFNQLAAAANLSEEGIPGKNEAKSLYELVVDFPDLDEFIAQVELVLTASQNQDGLASGSFKEEVKPKVLVAGFKVIVEHSEGLYFLGDDTKDMLKTFDHGNLGKLADIGTFSDSTKGALFDLAETYRNQINEIFEGALGAVAPSDIVPGQEAQEAEIFTQKVFGVLKSAKGDDWGSLGSILKQAPYSFKDQQSRIAFFAEPVSQGAEPVSQGGAPEAQSIMAELMNVIDFDSLKGRNSQEGEWDKAVDKSIGVLSGFSPELWNAVEDVVVKGASPGSLYKLASNIPNLLKLSQSINGIFPSQAKKSKVYKTMLGDTMGALASSNFKVAAFLTVISPILVAGVLLHYTLVKPLSSKRKPKNSQAASSGLSAPGVSPETSGAIIPSVSITASDSAKEGLGKPNAEPEGLTLGGDRNTSRGPGLGGTSDA